MKFILDIHTHTVASGHAYSTVIENALAAKKKGLALIAVTDHAPKMPGSCGAFHFDNLDVLPEFIHEVEILPGVELNIIDKEGHVDLDNRVLKKLKVVIASLHPPCIEFGTEEENTNTLINTMKNEYINIIGHPCDPRYPFDVEKVVKMAKETNTLLEVNNTSLKPYSHRRGGEKKLVELVKLCKKYNHPVVLGSDAHFSIEIGDFQNTVRILNETEMPSDLIANTSVELFKNIVLNN